LTANTIRSAFGSAAGSSLIDGTGTCASPSGLLMRRPCSRIACAWRPRAMNETFSPAASSRAPK